MGGLPTHGPGGGVAVAALGARQRAGHVRRDPLDGRVAVVDGERVGLDVAPDGGIVVPVPVVGEAGLELEPLPGEAPVHYLRVGVEGRRRPERRVGRAPHLLGAGVRHQHRPHQVVDVDEVQRRRCPRTVDHRNRQLAQPDVLLLRLPGGVELGDDVVVEVVDVERRGRGRRARLRHRARRQPALRVVAVGRPVRRRTRPSGCRWTPVATDLLQPLTGWIAVD